jgi:DNA repair protein RecN (Recombination protein N)
VLSELHARNYALFDDLTLDFSPGLTVLTGETGVGKSILVEALSAALGEPVGAEVVRKGCPEARVDALFEPSTSVHLREVLEEAGHSTDDGGLLISRRLSSKGRSRAYLNDRPVSLSLVKRLGDHLVDFHGQHTHQLLLNPAEHLLFVDAYGELVELRARVASLVQDDARLSDRLTRLREQRRRGHERAEYLRYQVRELEGLGLQEGEEEAIRRELTMRESAERLTQAAAQVQTSLYEAEDCVLGRLKEVHKLLESMNAAGAGLEEECGSVQAVAFQLEDVARKVQAVTAAVEDAPGRLETLRERISTVQRLKRRHGTEDLLEVLDSFKSELAALETLDDGIREAEDARAELLSRLRPQAVQLSSQRRTAARKFSQHVEQQLAALAMDGARMEVRFTAQPGEEEWSRGYPGGRTGLETAEFLLAANPGEGPRPLARVASGGEISRIMLAIKAAIQRDRVGTMVFDEIDAGIGGETADLVGQKLREVAARTQVLCVTHLARIACRADTHYHVIKQVRAGRTLTRVARLEGEERVVEVARMLSGEATSASLAHARELLADSGVRHTRGT